MLDGIQQIVAENHVEECGPETSVPDWVIDRPESLRVFEELGIDYSCGGKSLETACRERGLDVREVMKRIEERGPSGGMTNV